MKASNKFEIDRLIETIEALRNQVDHDSSLIKSDFENFKNQVN